MAPDDLCPTSYSGGQEKWLLYTLFQVDVTWFLVFPDAFKHSLSEGFLRSAFTVKKSFTSLFFYQINAALMNIRDDFEKSSQS